LIVQGVYRYIFTEDEGTSFLGITAGLVFWNKRKRDMPIPKGIGIFT
jgi:hypothetical protein